MLPALETELSHLAQSLNISDLSKILSSFHILCLFSTLFCNTAYFAELTQVSHLRARLGSATLSKFRNEMN